ncbi:MAG: hypothetical protein OXH68_20935 [Gammaproteobacteria bacterium]|nr:hypothetical protein [Gammaproteobacteria bacterium]
MAEKETSKLNALADHTWRAIRRALLQTLHVVVYPFHAVAHLVLVHLVPLFAIVVVLVAAPALVFLAWLGAHQNLPQQAESVAVIVEFTTLIGILGIIPMLVGKLWGRLAETGKQTLAELRALIAGPWVPNFPLPESFADTAELRRERARAAGVGLRGAARLFLALALVALVAILVRATVLPRDGVDQQLEELAARLDAFGDPRAPLFIAVSDLRLALQGTPPVSAEVTARLDSLRGRVSTLIANAGGDAEGDAEHPLIAPIKVHLANLENALRRDTPQADHLDAALTAMLIEVSKASIVTSRVQADGSINTILMHILVELQNLRSAIQARQQGEPPTLRTPEQPPASQANGAPDHDLPPEPDEPATQSATGPGETDSPGVDRGDRVMPEIIAFPDGVVFSVTHLVDAKLDAQRTGICLNKTQVDWLSAFKQAIAECSADKHEPLELEVLGYSSIAPALGPDGTDAETVRWNRRIADERGAVVAKFLLLEEGQDFSPEACAKGMNKDMTPYVDARVKATTNYRVSYTPWSRRDNGASYPVPVDDGDYPGVRRFASELLNRSAHIVIKNDVCSIGSTRTLATNGSA